MRLALAILMGVGIAAVGYGVFRSLVRPAPQGPSVLEAVKPPALDVRVSFWCETCGAELLLMRAGSAVPPKHCGEPMNRREEILRGHE